MKCETPAGVKRVSGMKSHNNHGSDAGELLDERCLLMVTQPAAREAAEEPEQNSGSGWQPGRGQWGRQTGVVPTCLKPSHRGRGHTLIGCEGIASSCCHSFIRSLSTPAHRWSESTVNHVCTEVADRNVLQRDTWRIIRHKTPSNIWTTTSATLTCSLSCFSSSVCSTWIQYSWM